MESEKGKRMKMKIPFRKSRETAPIHQAGSRMKVRALGIPAFLAAVVLLSTEAGAVPVISNPSFEQVQIGSPFFSTNVSNVPGWTRTGAVGDAAVWRIGYVDGGGSIIVAGEGEQFTTMGGGATGVTGETHWSQTITGFDSGQNYVLGFMMANEHGTVTPQFAIPQTITVSFTSGSDTAPQSFTEDSPPGDNYWRVWVAKSMMFHATDSNVTIDFSANTPYDVGLDNVTVSAAIPEPETYALMLAGLGLLGIIARRRKYKAA